MSIKFKYTKITGHYFCMASDEWEEDGVEFDYEVEDKDLLPVIVNLVFEDYFESNELYCDNEAVVKDIKENILTMIEENDLIEVFFERYEETLKEIFRDEAMEFYND